MLDRSAVAQPAGILASRDAASGPGRLTAEQTARIAIGIVTVVGLALRVAAARGDLWLDEIWSLNLVAGIRSAGQVFWGISHDNNHFLNSLYLYWIGPDRSPLIYRLPAVACGTLSIVVAARIGWRRGPATAVIAAVLTAFSYPLVDFASEARGYAGLVLAILVAIGSFEQAMQRLLARHEAPGGGWSGSIAQSWILGGAVGLGALSHLTMLGAVAVLGVTAIIELLAAGRSPWETGHAVLWLFLPSILLLIPALAAVEGGIMLKGALTVGGVRPFSAALFFSGYGDLLRALLGLPRRLPTWMVFSACCAGMFVAWRYRLFYRDRAALAAVTLVGMPTLTLFYGLPNTQFPRYFLMFGVVVLLLQADLLGRLWNRNNLPRWAAAAVLLAIVGGQVVPLAYLLRDGRGDFSAVLTTMSSEGRPAYASNNDFRAHTIVDYMAPRFAVPFIGVARADVCREKPDWYLDSRDDDGTDPPSEIDIGPPGCRVAYLRRGIYPRSALLGMRWTLYKRRG